ncbi:MAG: hypothetical protein VX663_02725, partial [Pseudomonadota bacterium]|nr:hypothetical protein [Pseudomonadota bacterium]
MTLPRRSATHTILRGGCVVGTALLAAGCVAVGPDYTAPRTDPPVAWQHAQAEARETRNDPA